MYWYGIYNLLVYNSNVTNKWYNVSWKEFTDIIYHIISVFIDLKDFVKDKGWINNIDR